MDKTLLIISISVLGGLLYRFGGWEKGNRLFRILGIPFASLLAIWGILGLSLAYWWAYFLTFGLTAGAVSAYWGIDEKRFGFWAHGLGLSLAVLPIAYVTGHWLGFAIRTVALTAFITIWSEYTKWDILEEFGRGFGIISTLFLLLI
jgi:hypothetical protein